MKWNNLLFTWKPSRGHGILLGIMSHFELSTGHFTEILKFSALTRQAVTDPHQGEVRVINVPVQVFPRAPGTMSGPPECSRWTCIHIWIEGYWRWRGVSTTREPCHDCVCFTQAPASWHTPASIYRASPVFHSGNSEEFYSDYRETHLHNKLSQGL